MTVPETMREPPSAGDSRAGPSAGEAPWRSGGALRRRARFPRYHHVPAVAFSPDWPAWMGALTAESGATAADDTAVYAFDSGRSGLRFALERLAEQAPERRQVVVPAYCCYSVAAAVEHAGLELVVCDIDPRTLDLAPEPLAQAVGPNTLCIIVAHLFGCGVDTAHAGALARQAGCYLVEDAAQAPDPLDGPPAAAINQGVTLRLTSTGRGKPLSTGGGGFVSLHEPSLQSDFDTAYARLPERAGRFDDAAQAARVALMKLLVHPRLFWAPAALPGLGIGETVYPDDTEPDRMAGFQRRLYARLRNRFERERQTRQRHADVYRSFLREQATVPQVQAIERPGYAPHRLPVYLGRDRADVESALRRARRGGVAPVYPAALSELPRVRRFCANPDDPVPGAAWTARHLVTLPTHAHVDPAARQRVLNALRELGI